ncbi:MAG: hypothetical protein ACREBG_01895 [Pyrinomonadaceae bacterium]
MPRDWEVVVSNIGVVYAGHEEDKARFIFRGYCKDSKANYGKAAGESVALFADGEIKAEYLAQ